MGLGDIIIDIIFAFNAVYMAIYVCKMRRTKKTIIFITLADSLCLIIADYILRVIIPQTEMDVPLYIAVAFFELIEISITAFMCRRDFWRNMFFIALALQVTNCVCGLFMSIHPMLEEILYKIVGPANNLDLKSTLIACAVYAVTMVLVAIPISWIYNHTKQSFIYKYIVLVYYTFSVISGIYRLLNSRESYDNHSESWLFVSNYSWIVPLLFGLYLLGYMHKKSEYVQKKKELELMEATVAQRCKEYESLSKSNETLRQIKNEYENELDNYDDNAYAGKLLAQSKNIEVKARTGGLIMDTTLSLISKTLDAADISFEYTFEHTFNSESETILTEMEMAYIFEKMSIVTILLNKEVEGGRYLVFSERNKSGTQIIKIEFSKNERVRLKEIGDQVLVSRLKNKPKKEIIDIINELHILVSKYEGVINIEDNRDSAVIGIMVS